MIAYFMLLMSFFPHAVQGSIPTEDRSAKRQKETARSVDSKLESKKNGMSSGKEATKVKQGKSSAKDKSSGSTARAAKQGKASEKEPPARMTRSRATSQQTN